MLSLSVESPAFEKAKAWMALLEWLVQEKSGMPSAGKIPAFLSMKDEPL